jgi:hypothetical protein
METIRLTLTRPDGTTVEQCFPLQGDLDSLDGIEAAVEQFKNQALPLVEKALLEQAQERHLTEEKKTLLPDG